MQPVGRGLVAPTQANAAHPLRLLPAFCPNRKRSPEPARIAETGGTATTQLSPANAKCFPARTDPLDSWGRWFEPSTAHLVIPFTERDFRFRGSDEVARQSAAHTSQKGIPSRN